ncbi:hypothetical protein [Halobacillus massiliensis]|uniref:hypothetical protein n=1 Tax=Halobacillus massiliensis TaxID=1926286 RepID=UPI00117A6B3E|nr:hypothetical protein [Halobacillus massiliensis]
MKIIMGRIRLEKTVHTLIFEDVDEDIHRLLCNIERKSVSFLKPAYSVTEAAVYLDSQNSIDY